MAPNKGVKIQKKDKDMNKILKTVLANTDFQKRICSDNSQQVAFEKTLGLGEKTLIAIKAVPKLLAVSILLSLGSIAWAGGSGSSYPEHTCNRCSSGIPGPTGPQGPMGPEGPQGPAGEKGEKGDTGAQGETGAKGDTGAVGATGAKGDKGDTGATGLTGATGAKGDKGDTGAVGATGAKGIDGKDGLNGLNGTNGIDGARGSNAYQVAVEQGYTGTESQWLESLKGATGQTGSTGSQGLSAYEVALNQGFDGTESQWLLSLKGENGQDGLGAEDVLKESKAYIDHRVNELNSRFDSFRDGVHAAVASSIAIASLPQPTDAGYNMFSVGMGTWEGKQGYALGFSGVTESNKYVYKVAATSNSEGDFGAGASIGWQWK